VAAAPDFQPGSDFAGHRIEAVAGRGGMGVVYRAIDLRLSRRVALKLISPEWSHDPGFRKRFERESQTAAAIRHPHVITIFQAGEYEGLLFITMEYIEGPDLRALISRSGPLDAEFAATVVVQIASALDAAHRIGLIHRDVKPANVLVPIEDGVPHAYLTDFGLTKLRSSESGPTRTGVVVGTVDYMSPEQAEGRSLDPRSDVYALGCVLYEALTREVPYPRDTPMATLYAHTHLPPPSAVARVPALPLELDLVVGKAMSKRPEGRYLSAGELGRGALAAARGRAVAPQVTRVHRGRVEEPRDAATEAPDFAVALARASGRHSSSLPSAGWYKDPRGGAAQRYWDGGQWTDSGDPPEPDD
jgi:serine/threonine protein kinase